ncbi:MAG: aromatic amino acid DMT transporter YddG [Candidatus Dactylopiibacterium sp.]|nr:aromatic amino acid DMT transporter YddG [Candidatus Dactylopiibacterium sp.]
MNPSPRGATLAGLVAILFWSTSVGVLRSTTEALGPTGAPAILFTLASVLLWPTRTAPRDIPRPYLWLGATLFVGYELCFALSLGYARSRAEALEVGMVNYLWPSLTVLCSVLAARQRLNATLLAGLAIALGGVIAATSPASGFSPTRFFHNLAANPLSYGLALLGAVVWSLYSTCTRHLAGGKNGLWLFMTLSAVAFWALHALQGGAPPMRWSPATVGLVIFSGLSVTLAYGLWNTGVLHGNLHALGLAANATPLLSALFASVLLSTTLPGIFWLGAAMVATGSLLAGLGARRRAGA